MNSKPKVLLQRYQTNLLKVKSLSEKLIESEKVKIFLLQTIQRHSHISSIKAVPLFMNRHIASKCLTSLMYTVTKLQSFKIYTKTHCLLNCLIFFSSRIDGY